MLAVVNRKVLIHAVSAAAMKGGGEAQSDRFNLGPIRGNCMYH
jgi:hypothetical protein